MPRKMVKGKLISNIKNSVGYTKNSSPKKPLEI